MFHSVKHISEAKYSQKFTNRLSTFSTQVKQQRRELEKAKIIDYSEKLKTDEKRYSMH